MLCSARTILLALFAVIALAAAGCGGGDVAADEVPGGPPALVVPSDSELGAGGSNADASTSDSGASDSSGSADQGAADGGTTAPQSDTSGGATAPEPQATAAPDTAQEESPPPAGSPPEQFESFCEQNAGAC